MTDKEYIATIEERSTKELMSNMSYYGCDPYYRDLWMATCEEMEKRLNNYDKIMRGEITIEEVSTEQEICKKANELIDGDKYRLFDDILKSNGFALYYDDDRDILLIYDVQNDEIYGSGNEDYCKASEIVSSISAVLSDSLYKKLAQDAENAGIKDIPSTTREWRNAIIRPDLQDFIESHKTEIAEICLMADTEKLNSIDIFSGRFKAHIDKDSKDIDD